MANTPGFRFKLEVEGFAPLDVLLGVVLDRTADMSPLWPDLAQDIALNNRKQIDSKGRHGSTPYAALSPAYARWKAEHFPGRPILVRTGEMRDTLTNTRSPKFHFTGRKRDMEIVFENGYALYHQRGVTGSLPRRPPMVLTDAQRRDYPKKIHEYLWKSGGIARRVLL